MKQPRPKTLAQQLRWQLVLVAIAFGFAIVLSVSVIAWRSVEFAADNFLKMEAQTVEQELLRDESYAVPMNKDFQIYLMLEDMPKHIIDAFEGIQLGDNEVFETQITNERGVDEYVSLLPYASDSGIRFYVVSQYDSKETDKLIERIFDYLLVDALWLLIFIYLVLLLLVFWVLRKTNEPMKLLSNWANELKDDNYLSRQQFPIEELNQLASQLKTGVDRITEYNLREQQFLKHASHEMRTPLATIQACLDTLDFKLDGPESKTVQRALKASGNMRRLSQALLWLARESDKDIEKSEINLDGFMKEQVEEHQYLLQSRPVDIVSNVEPTSITIEAELLQIVVANLLRNALQYTQAGTIYISVDKDKISIKNPSEKKEQNQSEYQSFGLGLQLVSRICEKVGWRFDFAEKEDEVCVELNW